MEVHLKSWAATSAVVALVLALVSGSTGVGAQTPSPSPSPSPSPAPQCSDQVDNDGDGFVDFPDDAACHATDDDSEEIHGDPAPTLVVIRYRDGDGSFVGQVSTALRACLRDRVVVVRREVSGRDPVLWRASTAPDGDWKTARFPRANGRFYAVAKPKFFRTSTGGFSMCSRKRSTTIRVHR